MRLVHSGTYLHSKLRSSQTAALLSALTVVVPGESDPDVVFFGVVEVPDELHFRPAVNRRQLPPDGLTVVSGVRPGETLIAVVHVVTVVAVRCPERQTLPGAGVGSRRRQLCELTCFCVTQRLS